MKTKKAIVVVTGLLCVVALISLLKKDLWEVNSELLREEILSIDQSVETINLLDVTPFEWDVAYSFDPYTPKEKIYSTIGYKWQNIKETVSEGMNQLVFLKDGKVVCYLYGYPTNNGYSISFTTGNHTDVASILSVRNDLDFQIIRSDGIIYLRNY
ncbi:hypothetical protein [Desulfofalx alkaliphila]|uniref:hypothetical protein n=1 Tax=Desulfofalx alkaliphila TaxID=105483 RepID=UPI0004E20644|nr:hypothetical protein [Desulfofalx alkaliphila]